MGFFDVHVGGHYYVFPDVLVLLGMLLGGLVLVVGVIWGVRQVWK